MKYRMSEGLTNIGTPLKEAMERAPKPDGSLINEGTKKPEQEPVRSEAYAMIDKFLGNNLNSDSDYAEYSKALDTIYLTPPQRTWVGLMRGVRVEGDTVVISTKNNDAARELCGSLIEEMNR